MVVIPVLSVIVFGIMLISIPLFKKVQGGLDRVLGITRENLTGVRVIRAFGEEEGEIQKFDRETDALKRMQMVAAQISALMNPLTYVVINGGLVALIYVGALRVEAGILSQGQVVALVNYMSQILVELVKLANLIITVTKAVACAIGYRACLKSRREWNRRRMEVQRKSRRQEPWSLTMCACVTIKGASRR